GCDDYVGGWDNTAFPAGGQGRGDGLPELPERRVDPGCGDKALDPFAVGIPGFHRLPVLVLVSEGSQPQQGQRGLAGIGVGSEDQQIAHGPPSYARCLITSWAIAAAASTNVRGLWSAWTEIRKRAVPGGTLGGRIARMSQPAARRRFATCSA